MIWVGPVLARETFDRLEAAVAEAAGPLDDPLAEELAADGGLRPADGTEPPD